MPDVLIPDLDESSLDRLKRRAEANGRSLAAELRLILQRAARPAEMADSPCLG